MLVAAFALAAAVSIVCAVVLHPQRAPLFASPLHPDQVAEVQERLAAWNVPFTPASDNVIVDAARRSDLLLRLSMAGAPHPHVDGTGEILDKLGALTPQAVIDAQTRDGLAGDIELALRGIDGVQDAKVIVAPAKTGYFAGDPSRDASASVRITTADGRRLSADAVTGIRSFVAASVPGLDARNVTIVDDRGVALGRSGAQSDANDLQTALQSALDETLGAGSSIVRVHVDYDARTIDSKDVRRTPLAVLPISAATQDERYAADGKRYDRSSQQVDRGSETREISSSAQAGRVARITAAVFIDAAMVTDLEPVKSLAAATLGIDASRGDTLQVAAIAFSRTPPVRKDVWWLAYGAVVPLLPAVALAVGIVTALRYAAPPLTALAKGLSERAELTRTESAARVAAPASVRASLINEPPHTAAAIISALPAATAAAVLEMYPEHERAAIVKRMHRPASPLFTDAENFIARA
jgi:flagellar M-ring protein FliF